MHSAKGRKDQRDLIRIAHILAQRSIRTSLLSSYLESKDVKLLDGMARSPEFLTLGRATRQTEALRAEFLRVLGTLRKIESPR